MINQISSEMRISAADLANTNTDCLWNVLAKRTDDGSGLSDTVRFYPTDHGQIIRVRVEMGPFRIAYVDVTVLFRDQVTVDCPTSVIVLVGDPVSYNDLASSPETPGLMFMGGRGSDRNTHVSYETFDEPGIRPTCLSVWPIESAGCACEFDIIVLPQPDTTPVVCVDTFRTTGYTCPSDLLQVVGGIPEGQRAGFLFSDGPFFDCVRFPFSMSVPVCLFYESGMPVPNTECNPYILVTTDPQPEATCQQNLPSSVEEGESICVSLQNFSNTSEDDYVRTTGPDGSVYEGCFIPDLSGLYTIFLLDASGQPYEGVKCQFTLDVKPFICSNERVLKCPSYPIRTTPSEQWSADTISFTANLRQNESVRFASGETVTNFTVSGDLQIELVNALNEVVLTCNFQVEILEETTCELFVCNNTTVIVGDEATPADISTSTYENGTTSIIVMGELQQYVVVNTMEIVRVVHLIGVDTVGSCQSTINVLECDSNPEPELNCIPKTLETGNWYTIAELTVDNPLPEGYVALFIHPDGSPAGNVFRPLYTGTLQIGIYDLENQIFLDEHRCTFNIIVGAVINSCPNDAVQASVGDTFTLTGDEPIVTGTNLPDSARLVFVYQVDGTKVVDTILTITDATESVAICVRLYSGEILTSPECRITFDVTQEITCTCPNRITLDGRTVTAAEEAAVQGLQSGQSIQFVIHQNSLMGETLDSLPGSMVLQIGVVENGVVIRLLCNVFIIVPSHLASPEDVSAKQSNAEDGLVIYPNPASDFVSLRADESGSILITDMNGKMKLEQRVEDQLKIDLFNYPTGMYIVTLIADNGDVSTKKLSRVKSIE